MPTSLGLLTSLTWLYLGYKLDSNKFIGPLPSSMSNLVKMEKFYLNVATLSGPLPDFTRLTSLQKCVFLPSGLCRIPDFVPVNSACDFSVLPVCDTVPDCVILAEWLPKSFDQYSCCQTDGVTCEEDRVVILDLSKAKTGKYIYGNIPITIGELDKLRIIYLQGNFIDGNLPLSISKISTLQTADISNNVLSGVIPFLPTFDLIGIESNNNLFLPSSPTPIDSPIDENKETQNTSSTEPAASNIGMIIGGAALGIAFFLFLFAAVIRVVLLKRREQGKETDIELQILPKYSSPTKNIRMIKLLNSGGFGVVWKARYQRKTFALKLIRMDKYEDKDIDDKRKLKIVKMVIDEASIMELMVHERIVRFIMFEIESLGIVLEYLPLGSLDGYIKNSKGVMPWTDRYQMMLDIFEGMEFLHSKVYADGSIKKVLLHQDLKSGNVLLCMEGSPPTLRGKISDFGLSCKCPIILILESSLEGQPYKQKCDWRGRPAIFVKSFNQRWDQLLSSSRVIQKECKVLKESRCICRWCCLSRDPHSSEAKHTLGRSLPWDSKSQAPCSPTEIVCSFP
jgi:hypothetical protein